MLINRRSFLQYSACFGAGALSTQLFAAASQASPASLTMQLDWVFNVQFAGLLMADHLGLYKQKGLDIAIKPWASGMVVPQEVAGNPLMIGCAEQNLILEAQAKGAPLKAIATMFQASPLALMSMPDAGVSSLSDLVGKKVGVHVDGIKVMELVKGVSGLSPSDIEVVEIPYDNKADRLISGEFAAIQCYAVDEPIAFSQRIGKAPGILSLDEYGYKAYAQVFFTTSRLLETQPQAVKAFLDASFEGWRRSLADIPGAARLIAEKYATPNSKYTDVEYQTQSLELIRDYMMRGIEPSQLGMIAGDRWQQTADLMAQYKIIDTSPTQQASLDLSLWPGQ